MRIKFLSFVFVVSLFKLLEIGYESIKNIESNSDYFSESLPSTISAPRPICYAEQLFALGLKMDLSRADLYDLELIPGVSDNLAINILSKRDKLISSYQSPNWNMKTSPFELIHGVGKQTAKKLDLYLELK